jgi:hypothetical protein
MLDTCESDGHGGAVPAISAGIVADLDRKSAPAHDRPASAFISICSIITVLPCRRVIGVSVGIHERGALHTGDAHTGDIDSLMCSGVLILQKLTLKFSAR